MVSEPPKYPWYEPVTDGTLQQGDLLESFEVIVPADDVNASDQDVEVDAKKANFIVLTQSCDIGANKVGSLLLCPVVDLWAFVAEAKKRKENWGKDQREKLHQGNLPGYHLLNLVEGSASFPRLLVVDFHEVYTAPLHQVRAFCDRMSSRYRLLPPYREHLAQAFARFFMRVGLPIDIPKDLLKEPLSN